MTSIPRSLAADPRVGETHYFFDSSFPVGYFSHSFGFETKVAEYSRVGFDACKSWILNYVVFSIWYSELEAMEHAQLGYRPCDAAARESIEAIDHLLFVSRSTKDARRGSQLIAGATKRAAVIFLGEESGELLSYNLKEPAVVIGVIAAIRSWNMATTRLLYMQSHALALSQVLLRYAKIGQNDQILLMAELLPTIGELALHRPRSISATFGKTCMEIDMDQMRHETLTPRLFQS